MPEPKADKIKESIAALEAQRTALGNAVVDPAIAALRQQLSQLQVSADKQPADERKIVTIVFADISGFTALSEKKDPEDVRALMNACFESLVPVVQKYEGTIDKFIGDEIMALFGAPVAHEDDPERALHAALEMMDAIVAVNRLNATELGIHIGINSGPVIAGQIGAANRRDYSVMGDAVNLAARLEDASSSGEIFVGPSTYQQTAHAFEFEKIPPLTLKGKEAPVHVHRLVRAKTTAKSRRGIEGLRAELVGRDSELGRVRRALDSLKRDEGGICAIFGEAGIGKSRLIAEARAAAQNSQWAEGRALSYTVGMSYWLSRAVLMDLFQIEPDAEPAGAAAQLRTAIEQELPHKVLEVYPYLARLFEWPLDGQSQERVKFLSTEALQSRILQAAQDYIRARAKRRPLVLIWEDMHWSDPSSLDLFESLLPLINDVPLLLICIARSDENPATDLLERVAEDFPGKFEKIELAPLTREQSRSLFEQLLKIDKQQTRDLILDRADGNPFFLEELVRSLIDTGALVAEENRLVATREINALDVPETLQSTLMTRIDRLRSPVKITLQHASVIGRVFEERVLERLHRDEVTKLAESLEELQRREFVRLQDGESIDQADHEYLFKHAITHDVTYNSMLVARRRELHKSVAEALEQFFEERLDDLSATLGYHFQKADAPEHAIPYLERAAERARATFANAEAIAFYRSAIAELERAVETSANLRKDEVAARLNEGLGDVLGLIGEQDESRHSFERALSCSIGSDAIARSRLLRKIGHSHSWQRHYKEAVNSYDLADQELEARRDNTDARWWEEKFQIQLERMHLLYWQGMAPEMRALANRYQSAAEKYGSPIQRAKFFLMQSLSLLTGSRYRPSEECLTLAERAVAASEASTDLSETPHIRFVFGLVNLFHGNFSEAIEHCGAALELSRRCGDVVAETRCLTYLAVAYRRAGNVDLAGKFADRTLALASKLAMTEYVAMAKATLAWVAWKTQRLDDCDEFGREALALWHGMDDPYSFDWMALWPLIATALAQKQTEQAIQLAEGLFPNNQHPIDEEVMSATKHAIESWNNGQIDLAASQLRSAVQIAEQHHYI
ncbi:MAG TPA: adenylate/guanylate cyclase domain-containing protein [Chthoniobacterales bacterium]|jgi:class 3 adenylate cyclase/tetratricopeptide (TPR) repeat protein|nr:adenylate/guanylate cyclase domain-containing protein [Chthoniobacterales bacterium]